MRESADIAVTRHEMPKCPTRTKGFPVIVVGLGDRRRNRGSPGPYGKGRFGMSGKARPAARPLAICLLVMVPTIAACGTPLFGVRGSGEVITESRQVSGFDEISLRGSGTATVEVTGTDSLTIEAEDNLIDYLESDVVDGRLELGSDRAISPTVEILYTITVRSLDALDVSGSGDMTVIGTTGDALDLRVSGSGSIDMAEVETMSVSVSISGSGSVGISGMTEDLDVTVSGSGEYDGADLVTGNANVTVSGSGDAIVNVTGQLDARVSGSGNVEYLGDPVVNASTTGSGDVVRR